MINYRVLAVSVFVCLLFMMNMLLISQVHYVTDVAGGLVFSIWFYRTSIRTVLYTDKFISFPFWLGKKAYERCRKKEEAADEKQEPLPIGPAVTERNLNDELVEGAQP
jgi:hypothetical protein